MTTHRFIRPIIVVASMTVISGVGLVFAHAADQSPAAAMPSHLTKQVFTEPQETLRYITPVVGVTPTQGAWVGEIEDSLKRYQASYPTSNFDPYAAKLNTVKRAVSNGQKEVVRAEMGVWLKMLRTRANGINDVAADELFNYSVKVAPIQEYRISVPPSVEFGMPSRSQQ